MARSEELGALLDEARHMRRSRLLTKLRDDPLMTNLVDEMMKRLRGAGDAGPAPTLEVSERVESVADQLIAHSWARFLRHTFLSEPAAAERYTTPVAALDAVARWANCEPVACVLAQLPMDDGQSRIVYAAALLQQIARTGSLYCSDRRAGIGVDDSQLALVPFEKWVERFQERYRDSWRYADRVLALAGNPFPRLPGDDRIRFDGTCFRGATGLKYDEDARTLDEAATYYPGTTCSALNPSREIVDRKHHIGTLAHSLDSVLALLASNNPGVLSADTNPARVNALRAAISGRSPDHEGRDIHPGWLAALHLAYSDGLEPLSLPQVRQLWSDTLFPKVWPLLRLHMASPSTRSSWLDAALARLPPMREALSDHALVQWVTFLRDDVPEQLALAQAAPDGERDQAEIDRLQRWCVAGDRHSFSFYTTPSAHFDLIATNFDERLQALLPLDTLWTLQEAMNASARGDAAAFRNLTAWLDVPWQDAAADLRLRRAEQDDRADLQRQANRFRDAVLAQPSLLARARESLREEGGRFRKPGNVATRAHILASTAKPPATAGGPVLTPGTLLGLLPIVGALPSLYDDYKQRDLAGALIDGGFLLLSVADMYGVTFEKCFTNEVKAALRGSGAILADSEIRESVVAAEQSAKRLRRVGAVYRELDEQSPTGIRRDTVVAHEPATDRLQRIELETLQTSPPALHDRFTVRATSGWLNGLAHFDDAAAVAEARFDDFFALEQGTSSEHAEMLRAMFAEARDSSPSFRRLLAAAHRQAWVVSVNEKSRFQAIFAEDSALEENRITLGLRPDLANVQYMSVAGPQAMRYRRAVLHEWVHGLTGLRDTPVQTACVQQEVEVRRMSAELDATATEVAPGASTLLQRRVEQGRRNLEAAQQALDATYEEMAGQRGPVVYITDRILQECGDGSPERTMYLAGPVGDATRQAVMARRRDPALAQLHTENDRLDRVWVSGLKVDAQTRMALGRKVGDSAVVKAWQQLVTASTANPPGEHALSTWLSRFPPRFTTSALLESTALGILEGATERSQTFRMLLSAWCHSTRTCRPWTFVKRTELVPGEGAGLADRGGRRMSLPVDYGHRMIDLGTHRFIATSLGMQRITSVRAVISGVVDLMLYDLNVLGPATGVAEGRSLGAALEQHILDEVGPSEPLRINGALYAEAEWPSDIDQRISAMRRVALLEDAMIRQGAREPSR
ncbi:hypothetical protein [Chitinasiproducens palmae]|nr:hypothetical protein [Chitinasiproducens palmae]